MLRELAAAVSFLTVLPAGRHSNAAHALGAPHVFPLVGLLVGLIAGLCALAAGLASGNALLGGLAAAGALVILTGMHHLDGLADIADSMMRRGSAAERHAALRDPHTGTAGTAAVALYLISLVAVLGQPDAWAGNPQDLMAGAGLLAGIIAAEAIAKLAMAVSSLVAVPVPRSSSAPFAAAARRPELLAATAFAALVPAALIAGPAALAAAAVAVIAAIATVRAAARGLGGLTGDSLGAAHELARLAALVVLVALP